LKEQVHKFLIFDWFSHYAFKAADKDVSIGDPGISNEAFVLFLYNVEEN
jgi:hypothetical protein